MVRAVTVGGLAGGIASVRAGWGRANVGVRGRVPT